MIRLAALDAAKAELYMAFRASSIRKTELARRLGIPKTTIDRLFDLDRHTRLDQMEAAFAALGSGSRSRSATRCTSRQRSASSEP